MGRYTKDVKCKRALKRTFLFSGTRLKGQQALKRTFLFSGTRLKGQQALKRTFLFSGFLLSLVVSCPPKRYPIYFLNVTSYKVYTDRVTKDGIRFRVPYNVDADKFAVAVDQKVRELETCLGKKIRRDWFAVFVPDDWYVSKCSGEQLVPSKADPKLCRTKGLVLPPECEWVIYPNDKCPCVCNFRAVTQDNYYIVTAPNLKLFKNELASIVLNNRNLWVTEWAKCL